MMTDPSSYSTGDASFQDFVDRLTNLMAEGIHNTWMQERLRQGWSYGPERNDARKEHPCLVPYAELPESEKVIDLKTAESAITSLLAHGYEIIPKSTTLEPACLREISEWHHKIKQEAENAMRNGSRQRTFDMDDAPEIDVIANTGAKVAKEVLQEIQEMVYPAWKEEDQTALFKQRGHFRIAAFAIWPGILAVMCAILQLSLHHFGQDFKHIAEAVLIVEFLFAAIAGSAVVIGLASHAHHGWLAHRQRAERLRGLKFQSLTWPELWCDRSAWKTRLASKVNELRNITTKSAHEWAKEKDEVFPGVSSHPPCLVGEIDLKVLNDIYLFKRLEFQRRYFQVQSMKADQKSWAVKSKLGLMLFFLSIVFVMLHVGHHYLSHHDTSESGSLAAFDIATISMAALIPVLGFGFRAWLAAFEAPRSRNLYRAKALALDDYIQRSKEASHNLEKSRIAMSYAEHFFTNEHREWCRLQMEAEWFV